MLRGFITTSVLCRCIQINPAASTDSLAMEMVYQNQIHTSPISLESFKNLLEGNRDSCQEQQKLPNLLEYNTTVNIRQTPPPQ